MTALQLLDKRFAALAEGDYAAVYASYHAEAPLRRTFPDRRSYVEFAEEQLGEIEVRGWQSLDCRRPEPGQEEHLLLMELAVDGRSQVLYELALLIRTAEGWRYHSAQKLSADDYAGDPQGIAFRHFDQAAEKIRY